MTHPELQTLRSVIDAIDADIVSLLSRRFRTTESIGRLKAKGSLQPVDPDREAAQFVRIRELAQTNDINPEMAVAVFRIIIDEVVRNHRVA